ncbi:hypothetical protein [Paenibacillus sp. MSJ-34]|uniref:hypothetical protein n=1 Tax=Paenibacillus sp. MSJ-34 TaxID=2841529 RepID=UPI001C11224A|nr:hypothetical protein [Paenibacillus sp. MSJ-34]MBU5445428.1 hypothetical protein [Paenibacillus sp. MSJ-34]
MAMHIKDNLPFNIELLYSPYSNDGRRFIPVFWETEQEIDKNELIEIREMVPLYINFYTTETTELSQLIIETSRFNEDGEINNIVISSNTLEPVPLFVREFQNTENSDFPWRMGYYMLNVQYNGKLYYSGIQVTPNNLSLQQVRWIHQALEEITSGICYELILSQKGYSDDNLTDTPDKWYYDYIRWILSEKQNLLACIEYIRLHWHEEISTQYIVSNRGGKQDTRTEKWSQSYSGISYNKGIQPVEYELIKKKKLEKNNPQNQWIKNILTRWKAMLFTIHELVENDIELVEKEIRKNEEQKNLVIQRLEGINKKNDVPEGFKNDQKTVLHSINNQITKLKKWRSTLFNWNQAVLLLNGLFAYVLHSQIFRRIDTNNRKPFLKNRYYFLFNELFEQGNQIKRTDGDIRQYKSILKPTWQIYEYFCLFQVLNGLRKIGFLPLYGLPDDISDLQKQGIKQGTKYIFSHEVGEIHIYYGTLLPFSPEDATSTDRFYSQSSHRWPDLRLDFYKRTSTGGVEYSLHSMVFDAKLSKFKYLYRADIPNKAFTQLNSYTAIQHLDSLRSVVDRVCCLFAGGEDDKEIRKVHSVTFIRLCPIQDQAMDQGLVLGYSALVNFIREWLIQDIGLNDINF